MRGIRLTERQDEALEAIRKHIKRYGIPPSRTELGKATGIGNQSGVDRILSALAKKGWLRLFPSTDRGIQLLREGAPLLDPEDLPQVPVSNPVIPGDYPEPERLHDYDTLTGHFASRPDYFLRVKGDSMDLAGFGSGDVVAVREGGDPQDGDVVVARIGQNMTLKRYCQRNGHGNTWLQPVSSSDEHGQVRIDGQGDFEISGVVVGAIIGVRRDWTVT